MKTIPLSKGYFAVIDDIDIELVSQYTWCVNIDKYGVMAYARTNLPTGGTMYMHQIVAGVKEGFIIDHIDRNGLNNTRKNLRHTTENKNSFNSRMKRNNTSGFRGVHFNKNNKYESCIKVNRKKIHLGVYIDINDAIKARKEAEELYFPGIILSDEKMVEVLVLNKGIPQVHKKKKRFKTTL